MNFNQKVIKKTSKRGKSSSVVFMYEDPLTLKEPCDVPLPDPLPPTPPYPACF